MGNVSLLTGQNPARQAMIKAGFPNRAEHHGEQGFGSGLKA
jgi:acetyl-CoA acetyltransferase